MADAASPQPEDASTYLDLHVHSTDGSDDAGGSVEGYLRWVEAQRRRGYRIDGFVLTEHRHYDTALDYRALAERYDAIVLRGVEVETDVGHVLVFGVTPEFLAAFDVTDVALPYAEVFRVAWETGGVAVGAHAGRPQIGLVDHVAERAAGLEGVRVIEALNGGSSDYENARAHDLAVAHGLREVGASDSHFVSALGRCMTRFEAGIRTMEDLVAALRDPAAPYAPVRIEDTLPGAGERVQASTLRAAAASSGQGALGGEALEYDRDVVGRKVPVGRFEVTREAIAAYCDALEETNPLYTDEAFAALGPYGGIIAPPGILSMAHVDPPPDPRVRLRGRSVLGGARQEYYAPVRP
ncbi:MAG: PHP-associated domain-containing protein, partial [Dehalococcoidia bacterium]